MSSSKLKKDTDIVYKTPPSTKEIEALKMKRGMALN
jgi:hypothetical protein